MSSATGETIWSQPLAEVDVEYDINNRDDRKQLGLSPTFADGILVCPTGAGAAIAVDLTARTLLWAYRFTIPKPDDVRRLANGIQLRMQVLAGNMAGMQIKSSASGNTDGGSGLIHFLSLPVTEYYLRQPVQNSSIASMSTLVNYYGDHQGLISSQSQG